MSEQQLMLKTATPMHCLMKACSVELTILYLSIQFLTIFILFSNIQKPLSARLIQTMDEYNLK